MHKCFCFIFILNLTLTSLSHLTGFALLQIVFQLWQFLFVDTYKLAQLRHVTMTHAYICSESMVWNKFHSMWKEHVLCTISNHNNNKKLMSLCI